MTPDFPRAPGRCTACGRDHFVSVRFCPFCGVAQAIPEVAPHAAPDAPPPPPMQAPVGVDRPPEPPEARAPEPPPLPEETPEPVPIPPAPTRPARRRRTMIRLRQIVLALAAIAGLALLALGRRDVVPAPTRIEIGPAWTPVGLKAFRTVPLLRLTGDGAFSLRLDDDRVLRVAPGSGATVRPGTLRILELRAGRGPVTVTLTPRER